MSRFAHGKIGTALLALVGGGVLAPFVWLIFFVAPQEDDFCDGARLIVLGWWDALVELSQQMHGRHTTHVLLVLPTELHQRWGLDWFGVLEALAALLLLGLGLLCWWLMRILMPEAPRWRRAALALAMLAALVANARSVRDLLYWWPASVTYTLPAILLGAIYLALLRRAVRGTATRWPEALAIGAGLVIAAWCNEFSPGMALAIIAGSWAARRWSGHPAPQPWLHLAGVAVVAAAFMEMVSASGNSVRMGRPFLAGDLLPSVVEGAVYQLEFLALVVCGPGLVGWLLLAGGATAQEAAPRRPGILLLPAALVVIGCFVPFLVGYYVYQGGLLARAQNQPFVLATLALTSAVIWWRQGRPAGSGRWRQPAAAIGLLLVALSPGFLVALPQLADAPAYRAVYRQRIAELEASVGGAATVAPLTEAPPYLFQTDIGTPGGSRACVMRYYALTALETPDPFPRVNGFAPYWFEWWTDWARSPTGRKSS